MTVSLDRYTRPAAIRSHQLGEHRITYLPDGAALLRPQAWLPNADEGIWKDFAYLIRSDGRLMASIGALLVEHGNRAMLIDAGFGPLAVPTLYGLVRGGQLLESLVAVGKTLADIELIALTQLHLDHIGWLWQSVPSTAVRPFAQTPVLVGAAGWRNRKLANSVGVNSEMLGVFAPRVRTVTDGEEIFPGVRALAMPGHSLEHLAYVITSHRSRLIVFGDVIQTPLQITHPALTAPCDHRSAEAVTTRRILIGELTVPGTFGFGLHFADVQLGRVIPSREGRPAWWPNGNPGGFVV